MCRPEEPVAPVERIHASVKPRFVTDQFCLLKRPGGERRIGLRPATPMSSRPNAEHNTPLHGNGFTSNECDNGMRAKRDSTQDDQFQHPMSLDEVQAGSVHAHSSHESRINVQSVGAVQEKSA